MQSLAVHAFATLAWVLLDVLTLDRSTTGDEMRAGV